MGARISEEEGGRKPQVTVGGGSQPLTHSAPGAPGRAPRGSPPHASRGRRGEGGREASVGRATAAPSRSWDQDCRLPISPLRGSRTRPGRVPGSGVRESVLARVASSPVRACPEAPAPRGRGREALPGAGGAGWGGSRSGGDGPGAGGGGGAPRAGNVSAALSADYASCQ